MKCLWGIMVLDVRMVFSQRFSLEKSYYSYGISSIFFVTPELSKVVLSKVFQFYRVSQSICLVVNVDLVQFKAGVCGFVSRAGTKKYSVCKSRGRSKGPPLELFRDYASFLTTFFANINSLPRFSAETTAFCEHKWPLLILSALCDFLIKRRENLKKFQTFFPQFLVFRGFL